MEASRERALLRGGHPCGAGRAGARRRAAGRALAEDRQGARPRSGRDEEARSFYVLLEGRLKVTQVYPGTAAAVEDCWMIGFTKGAMQDLMERYPRLALNTLGTVGGRLQEMQTRLRELSTERVERRIAQPLIRLAEQAGKRVAGGIRSISRSHARTWPR